MENGCEYWLRSQASIFIETKYILDIPNTFDEKLRYNTKAQYSQRPALSLITIPSFSSTKAHPTIPTKSEI